MEVRRAVADAVAEGGHVVLAAVVHEADAPRVDVHLRELAVGRHRHPARPHLALHAAVRRLLGQRVHRLGWGDDHGHVVTRVARATRVGPRDRVRQHGRGDDVAAARSAHVGLHPGAASHAVVAEHATGGHEAVDQVAIAWRGRARRAAAADALVGGHRRDAQEKGLRGDRACGGVSQAAFARAAGDGRGIGPDVVAEGGVTHGEGEGVAGLHRDIGGLDVAEPAGVHVGLREAAAAAQDHPGAGHAQLQFALGRARADRVDQLLHRRGGAQVGRVAVGVSDAQHRARDRCRRTLHHGQRRAAARVRVAQRRVVVVRVHGQRDRRHRRARRCPGAAAGIRDADAVGGRAHARGRIRLGPVVQELQRRRQVAAL